MKVKLCGGSGCCPTVEVPMDTTKDVILKDDNGNTFNLTHEEWNILVDKIKDGEFEVK